MADDDWRPIPGYDGYEASASGQIRSVERMDGYGRTWRGRVLKTRVSNTGYELVNLRDTGGKPQTRSVHRLVLLAFVGPCPEGQETLHGPGGPLDNRLSNLRYGTKKENAADTIAAGNLKVPEPSHRCINYDYCGGRTANQGRRCRECVEMVGRRAGAMLNRGVNLELVAAKFGYTASDWVYQLAVEYGGYTGTKREARLQHPSLSQRVTTTLRARLGRGDKE